MLEWSIQWLTLNITDGTFDSLDFTIFSPIRIAYELNGDTFLPNNAVL